MAASSARPQSRKRMLTVPECAERMGVHHSTVRRYLHMGVLEYTRLPGGMIRVDADVLEAFLADRRRKQYGA